jgi:AMP-polyphosphate phosphotransferase
MRARDFIVVRRPALAKITKHPAIDFADYERRLETMQSVMQSIQQAYLGTRERAVIVLEGWDTAGKA